MPYYLTFKGLLKFNFRAQENDVLKSHRLKHYLVTMLTRKAHHKGELVIQMK
jgi:hypothetical protein